MTLAPGSRLGAYEIVALLGAGGMGEVYRARDLKLGRDVALKVLPASVASDAERLSRFEREARLLASLNHPYIGAIYGVEESPSTRAGQAPITALVLELVDGETLADRTARHSAMPLPEVVAIARQIADALDAAHDRGIVHRDLKPANIKITGDGTVKVLDFGLARGGDASSVSAGSSGSGWPVGADLTASPTMLAPTVQGVLLGTVPYMSPEQARGKAVDKRTDIWAFGCVLYEMLTRRRAFPGETASDTIAAILEREPDWYALPVTTPASIVRLLRRCLEKDPRRRLRDIGDGKVDLDDQPVAPPAADGRAVRNTRRSLIWMAAGVALGAAIAVGWFRLTSRAAIARDVQHQRLTDFVGIEESPAISPDGKTVAFVAAALGHRHIWVRLLAGGVPLRITSDAADHQTPRWSPDSSAIVYYVPSTNAGEQGAIHEISALGGAPRRITSAMSGGDVSHDGVHLTFFRFEAGHWQLVIAARDGSNARRVTTLATANAYEYPRWSPDDARVAFQRTSQGNFDSWLSVVSASGGEPTDVVRADYLRGLAWAPDGSSLVYSSSLGSTVLYPPVFNLRHISRDGQHDRPLTFGDMSYVEPDVHANGKVILTRAGETTLSLIGADGSGLRSIVPGWYAYWSPLGQVLYYTHEQDHRFCIAKVSVGGGRPESVRCEDAQAPAVARDGTLYYMRMLEQGIRGWDWQIYRARPEGGPSQPLAQVAATRVSGDASYLHPILSPDDKWLALALIDGVTSNLWALPVDGGPMRQLTDMGDRPTVIARRFSWSPDGRSIYAAVADIDADIVLLDGLVR